MDKIQIATLVAGAILPFLISLLKRWVTFTKEQISFLTLLVCFIVAAVIDLYENGWDIKSLVSRIAEVYATSQIVYYAVLKTLELDTRIETK